MSVMSRLSSKAALLPLLCLLGDALAAPTWKRAQNGSVATLELQIPGNRNDDLFYTVNIDFDGQSLPLMLDTGSADIMVASNECSNTDENSGCYGVPDRYIITNTTNILANESFYSVLGLGPVQGNQSIIPTKFGGIEIPDLATPLLYYAAKGQFQNGSFAGIWGTSMKNVSRQLYFNDRLPPIDRLISEGKLEKPLYSISLSRYADPESPATGNLTLGGIEEKYTSLNITYSETIDTQNYNYEGFPYARQGWTVEHQSIRVNGVQLNVSQGSLDPAGRSLSLIDSGAQLLYFRPLDFDAIVPLLDGPIIEETGNAIYYECHRPQLLELKYNDQWFPIHPLDFIIPGDHGIVNGTEYCRAPLGTWTRTFGDSIIGVPFLRSAFSVYDYVANDQVPQPRIGLASTVNVAQALSEYPSTYEARYLGSFNSKKAFAAVYYR